MLHWMVQKMKTKSSENQSSLKVLIVLQLSLYVTFERISSSFGSNLPPSSDPILDLISIKHPVPIVILMKNVPFLFKTLAFFFKALAFFGKNRSKCVHLQHYRTLP